MKILFITSTIVSIIVITLLVVINIVYNKDLYNKNLSKTTNNEETGPTTTTDLSTINIQPTNTSPNTITNTNKSPNLEDTLEIPSSQQISKCGSPFYVNKVIVYKNKGNESIDKLELFCNDNDNTKATKNLIEIRNTVNFTKIEYINPVGFTEVFVKKEKNILRDFMVSALDNFHLEKNIPNIFIKYSCPMLFKFSGIIIDHIRDDINISIICIDK